MFALLACPFAARALDLDLKLEPGAALSLNGQQSNRFEFGGAATLKGLVGFEGGYVNLAAGVTFLMALMLGGSVWGLHLVCDLLLAGYVVLLVQLQQRAMERDTAFSKVTRSWRRRAIPSPA